MVRDRVWAARLGPVRSDPGWESTGGKGQALRGFGVAERTAREEGGVSPGETGPAEGGYPRSLPQRSRPGLRFQAFGCGYHEGIAFYLPQIITRNIKRRTAFLNTPLKEEDERKERKKEERKLQCSV